MEQTLVKPVISPENILRIGTGFWASKILLVAVRFELFSRLAERKKLSAAEIKQDLNLLCTDRHLYDFLDALTIFGFLKRDGLLEDAYYRNSSDTDLFLDKNKPTYMGGLLELANNRLYSSWGLLEDGLLTGQAQNDITQGGKDAFTELYKVPGHLEEFIHAMSGAQAGNFVAFAKTFDFSGYTSLVDVGGSGAMLSIQVAKKYSAFRPGRAG